MLLEDAQWQKADKLLEQVLNHEPENEKAYIGKLMIDFRANKEENLGEMDIDFSENSNYQKVIRFADDVTKNRIQNYCNIVKKQLSDRENARKKVMSEYRKALACKEKYMKIVADSVAVIPISLMSFGLVSTFTLMSISMLGAFSGLVVAGVMSLKAYKKYKIAKGFKDKLKKM